MFKKKTRLTSYIVNKAVNLSDQFKTVTKLQIPNTKNKIVIITNKIYLAFFLFYNKMQKIVIIPTAYGKIIPKTNIAKSIYFLSIFKI